MAFTTLEPIVSKILHVEMRKKNSTKTLKCAHSMALWFNMKNRGLQP